MSNQSYSIGNTQEMIFSYEIIMNNQQITSSYSFFFQSKPIVQATRSIVPPIDIVTEMIIEKDDDDDNLPLDDPDGDMVIFYDDIEIVEHSSSSYSSSECDSTSSSSHHYSKPLNTSIPPPVPARTSKPNHQTTTTNKTYELERNNLRKKFDMNSVNEMFNRTEKNFAATLPHRLPSARHFAGKINPEDTPPVTNGHARQSPMKPSQTILPTRSLIADTNALVKQIQNSLRDTQTSSTSLSTSTKDLRTFVSNTYSPLNQNCIDNNGVVRARPAPQNPEDQTFKRQARLSKSFHNVSEYKSTDQYPKKEIQTQPSKSVENNLDQMPPPPRQTKQSHPTLNLTSLVSSTSFSALPNSDENARMLVNPFLQTNSFLSSSITSR